MAYAENVQFETTHLDIRFQQKTFNRKPDLENIRVTSVHFQSHKCTLIFGDMGPDKLCISANIEVQSAYIGLVNLNFDTFIKQPQQKDSATLSKYLIYTLLPILRYKMQSLGWSTLISTHLKTATIKKQRKTSYIFKLHFAV